MYFDNVFIISYPMQITGMKINSPPPSKKPTVTNTNQSSKVQSKKPTVVRNTVKKQTVQKVPPKKE